MRAFTRAAEPRSHVTPRRCGGAGQWSSEHVISTATWCKSDAARPAACRDCGVKAGYTCRVYRQCVSCPTATLQVSGRRRAHAENRRIAVRRQHAWAAKSRGNESHPKRGDPYYSTTTLPHLFPSGKTTPSLSHLPRRSFGPPFGVKSMKMSPESVSLPASFQAFSSGAPVHAPPDGESVPVMMAEGSRARLPSTPRPAPTT
jgi:hypothetical protein